MAYNSTEIIRKRIIPGRIKEETYSRILKVKFDFRDEISKINKNEICKRVGIKSLTEYFKENHPGLDRKDKSYPHVLRKNNPLEESLEIIITYPFFRRVITNIDERPNFNLSARGNYGLINLEKLNNYILTGNNFTSSQ